MSKKYYTPEIEEFHPGFEYELIPSIGYTIINFDSPEEKHETTWATEYEKGIYSVKDVEPFGGALASIKSGIISKKCRVKFLDINDIKSLNLNHTGGKLDGRTLQQFKGKVKKGYWLYLTCTFFSFGCVITINTSVSKNSEKTLVVHSITIKNKSELEKLLKQLNIK